MEFGKIVLLSIAAAISYGIFHDEVTAHICVEYFSVFHPPVFPTRDATLLALGWGIIATWWMGASLGLLLAIAARAGNRPKTSAAALIRPVLLLLLVMAVCAFVSGLTGYVLSRMGLIASPKMVSDLLPERTHNAFMANWWAHNTSYASAAIGGIILCISTFRRRLRQNSVN